MWACSATRNSTVSMRSSKLTGWYRGTCGCAGVVIRTTSSVARVPGDVAQPQLLAFKARRAMRATPGLGAGFSTWNMASTISQTMRG